MRALIQILDYGSGNLFSVKDSISRAAPDLEIKTSSEYVSGQPDGLVLPGVGSFSSAQRILRKVKPDIKRDAERSGMPVLGICLGMQLMFQKSEEGPGGGLSFFNGEVVRFSPEPGVKVPHMGWNTFEISVNSKEKSILCSDLSGMKQWAYFVHSFYPKSGNDDAVVACTIYGSQMFPSIIERQNIFGTQFHPEKSSATGFKLIENFVKCVSQYSRR